MVQFFFLPAVLSSFCPAPIPGRNQALRDPNDAGAFTQIRFHPVWHLGRDGEQVPPGVEQLRLARARNALTNPLAPTGTGIEPQFHPLGYSLGNVIKVDWRTRASFTCAEQAGVALKS